jgi:hypothetical protein
VEHEEHLMPDLEAYNELARRWERIRLDIIEASAQADTLMVPVPQTLARANADILAFPDQIRAEGARRAANLAPLTDWLESAGYERHNDEPTP